MTLIPLKYRHLYSYRTTHTLLLVAGSCRNCRTHPSEEEEEEEEAGADGCPLRRNRRNSRSLPSEVGSPRNRLGLEQQAQPERLQVGQTRLISYLISEESSCSCEARINVRVSVNS